MEFGTFKEEDLDKLQRLIENAFMDTQFKPVENKTTECIHDTLKTEYVCVNCGQTVTPEDLHTLETWLATH